MEEREKRRVRTPVESPLSRQVSRREGKRRARLIVALGCLSVLAACGPKADEAEAGKPHRRTPSGLPVPRYVTLKFGEVNARAGPGDDYRLLWTYRARNLPLQVVAETSDWRRVCDPDGGMAWVHQRTVDTRRMVMRRKADALDMHAKPAIDSTIVARLAGRAVASLDECKEGWCRIGAGGVQGWIPQAEVWGAREAAQCKPPVPVVTR